MSVEITVQIFPNPGAGIKTFQNSRGEIMNVPVPFMSYEKVREITAHTKDLICFVARDGTEIETNMPYLVLRQNVSEGNA